MAEEEKTVGRKKYGGVRRRLTVAQSIGDEMDKELEKRQSSKQGSDGADKDDITKRGSTREEAPHRAMEKIDKKVRRCSIQGQLTPKDIFMPFFSNKAINFSGLEVMKELNLGVVCHRGQKPEQCNQDDFFFMCSGGALIFGVCDGHGNSGEVVSHFAQQNLPEDLLKDGLDKLIGDISDADVEAKLKQAFADTQARLLQEHPEESRHSGCTATVIIQCPAKKKLWAASVGDSTAVIARREKGKKGQFQVGALTNDHKPNRPDERERIEASGGSVAEPPAPGLPSRLVTPEAGLAVSRSFGDAQCSKYGLSAEPEINMYDIDDEKEDYFVLACSDGVWEFLNFAQVVQMCAKFEPGDAQNAAEKLAHKSQLRWQEQESVVDDITVILVWGGYDVEALAKVTDEAETDVAKMTIEEKEGEEEPAGTQSAAT